MTFLRLIKSLKVPVNIYKCSEGCDFEVKGISCNSKTVSEGFIFAAVKGVNCDGNLFIDEAVKNGAKALIVGDQDQKTLDKYDIPVVSVPDMRLALPDWAAEFYGNPSSSLNVIGVTGTNGKTTVTYLIEAILKEKGNSSAVIGTVNWRFKDTVIPSKNTTPGPIELQSMLARILQEGVNYAVMEVSSHALHQERTGKINFRSGIFTNLTQDHLDYHVTMADYFQAKAKLFHNLEKSATAIINCDDAYGRKLICQLKLPGIISYGLDDKADVSAKNINFDIAHTRFLLSYKERKTAIDINLIGRHNVYNVLAAISWAINEGISIDIVRAALNKFKNVPGRLERIGSAENFSVFVDYAHTEDALKNVITSLRQVSGKRRIIVVFGCGGDRDKMKRPKMGWVVSELADYAIITSDNPRSEDPEAIIRDIVSGISKHNYCVIADRREAIKESFCLSVKGDIVLIAGKGHENYQVINNMVFDFDDRKVAQECLGDLCIR